MRQFAFSMFHCSGTKYIQKFIYNFGVGVDTFKLKSLSQSMPDFGNFVRADAGSWKGDWLHLRVR